MTPTLPRPFLAFVLCACSHGDPAPVAPGPPIRAEGEVVVDTMTAECQGLMTALEAYRDCTNQTPRQREGIASWMEATQLSLAAGDKAHPDARAQHAIAVSCRRATTSVKAATERCHNGPTPRVD